MPRHRFTRRQRAYRIYSRIYDERRKGISIKQIARRERISTSRVYYYVRLIRRLQRKQGVKIERLGKKFYYVPPELPPERPGQLVPQRGDVELRGYWNYTSPDYESRNLNIDCVVVVPNTPIAIIAARERIKQLVSYGFGGKVASMLHFGVSEVTPESRNHFYYRRGEGDQWLEF